MLTPHYLELTYELTAAPKWNLSAGVSLQRSSSSASDCYRVHALVHAHFTYSRVLRVFAQILLILILNIIITLCYPAF